MSAILMIMTMTMMMMMNCEHDDGQCDNGEYADVEDLMTMMMHLVARV
jgi:hypothetical protein